MQESFVHNKDLGSIAGRLDGRTVSSSCWNAIFPNKIYLHLVFCLFISMSLAASIKVYADAPAETKKIQLDNSILNAILRQLEIQVQIARLCEVVFEIGLVRAQNRPQLSAQIIGQTSLISNFDDTINDEDSALSRGLGEDEDGIFDLNFSLTKTLFDWDQYQYSISSKEQLYAANQYKQRVALSNQLRALLLLAFDYQHARNIVTTQRATQEQIHDLIVSIEAKGKTGVIALIDVRRAKLLDIDLEGLVKLAENELARIENELITRFGLTPSDIEHFPEFISQNRPVNLPADLPVFDVDNSLSVSALDLEIKAMEDESQAIFLEKRPVIFGKLSSSLFDLRDFEEEYEITGEFSVSMPLYDGGTNLARRGILDWQMSGLTAEKDRIIQLALNRQVENFSIISETKTIIAQSVEQRESMQRQLDNMLAISGNVAFSELAIIQQIIDLSRIQNNQQSAYRDIHKIFIDQLDLADKLLSLFSFDKGAKGC